VATSQRSAEREKTLAALSSVIAAVGLTGFKLVIGLLTHSLGILSEAAHSAFDLVAALVTLFAVRVSDRPADPSHPYGHGKIESLSALVETALLLITCGWIIYEAIQRLFFKSVEVEASIWAFVVMFTSIAVDVSRSRVLSNAARKYNSQALEADALHFGTDIWSSSVVLLGLVGVVLAGRFQGLAFLEAADAVAALGVAAIVIVVSIQLGRRTIDGLMDTTPKGMDEAIRLKVAAIQGVRNCHGVRVRSSGPRLFVDVHIEADGRKSLKATHDLTQLVESAIRELAPGADVTVHPEPADSKSLKAAAYTKHG
jgi:cation diffusion facilitator family transporter